MVSGVFFIYRDIGVKVLKEVFTRLPDLPATAITLMTSKPDGKGYYHIHISVDLDDSSRQTLKEIAANNGLVYRENQGRILIYRSLI